MTPRYSFGQWRETWPDARLVAMGERVDVWDTQDRFSSPSSTSLMFMWPGGHMSVLNERDTDWRVVVAECPQDAEFVMAICAMHFGGLP